MRTMAVNALVLALVLGCGCAAFGQPASGGEQKPKGPNPLAGPGPAPANAAKPAAPSTLEEMLALLDKLRPIAAAAGLTPGAFRDRYGYLAGS